MKYIVNGKIILPNEILQNKALVYDTKIIDIIDQENVPESADILDANGGYVSPGLIDIHIHGFLGADVSDGDADGIRKIANGIIKNGVTSWCPTTMTVSTPEINKALSTVRSLKNESKNWNGAEILGVNLEGPFINPEKKGAQASEHIKPLDAQFIINNADIISLTTVAPEMEGNIDEIKKIVKGCKVKVAIGHSNATYEEALEGIDAGATHITHLFNAQSGLNHRNPGVVGAALTTNTSCELICDTFHIHKTLFSLIHKLKKEKLVLITDSTRGGGMPDGEYTLGGQKITVNGVKCLLPDGTIAGSVLKLNEAVKNMRDNTNIPLFKIVAAASLNAARVIGEDKRKGSLYKGKDADIIITDSNFNVLKTIVKGNRLY
ncbi:MAG: N-acetylglucosamine-6-phosphate deacetylase [Clostridia bacterium]|nr:N-acetylglucosamine-6-phosphate deacetylase [Clostridia bacterium]